MAFRAELLITMLIALLAGLGIWMSYRQSRRDGQNTIEWASKWFAEFSTELAGAALITFTVLLVIVPAQREDRKQEYVRMMSSADNIAARQASEALFFLYDDGRARYDGSLSNRDFAYANWTDMHVTRSTLTGSNLSNAALVRTFLRETDLRNVDLSRANLTGADLIFSDLTGAIITDETVFSETTRLPDGSMWTDVVDIARFTNPQHPDHWKACEQVLTPPNCW